MQSRWRKLTIRNIENICPFHFSVGKEDEQSRKGGRSKLNSTTTIQKEDFISHSLTSLTLFITQTHREVTSWSIQQLINRLSLEIIESKHRTGYGEFLLRCPSCGYIIVVVVETLKVGIKLFPRQERQRRVWCLSICQKERNP